MVDENLQVEIKIRYFKDGSPYLFEDRCPSIKEGIITLDKFREQNKK